MKTRNGCIIYAPQKSVTTQKLIGKNVTNAFESISQFIKNCTTGDPNKPSSINLVAFSAFDGDDPIIGQKNVSEITAIFGPGKTEPISYSYPSGQPSNETKTEWIIDNANLIPALTYLIAGQPWPKYTFGPVKLIMSYSFKFIDPETKGVLAEQDSDSHLMIWLSRTNSCSPTLYFPFVTANSSFEKYVLKITPFLPFLFKRKHLRSFRKGKNGYIFKKL
ncbi:MAG: hypothetical protein V4456_07850 [Bacteroidota bacterium]